jgi:hypothetical protein
MSEMAPALTTYVCAGCQGTVRHEYVLTWETGRGTIIGHRRRDISWGIDEAGDEVRMGSGEWMTCGPIAVVLVPEETMLARALRSMHGYRRDHDALAVPGCPLCPNASVATASAGAERGAPSAPSQPKTSGTTE